MAKTVVILGGSYAGLHVAHYLLKQKIPDVKVILVSKVRKTKPPNNYRGWLYHTQSATSISITKKPD